MHSEFPAGTAVEDIVVEGPVGSEIISIALAWRPDLIVVGDHDRHGLAALIMGDTADDVARRARRARCAVLVVRAGDPSAPEARSTRKTRRSRAPT